MIPYADRRIESLRYNGPSMSKTQSLTVALTRLIYATATAARSIKNGAPPSPNPPSFPAKFSFHKSAQPSQKPTILACSPYFQPQPRSKTPSTALPAPKMEFFDFNALSRDDQQQPFSLLGLPDTSSMPGFPPDGLKAFSDPMMELPFYNEAWASLGNLDAGATMPFGLTDETPFQLSQPHVQQEMQIGLHQSQLQVTHESSYNVDESNLNLWTHSAPTTPSHLPCDWPSCTSQTQYDMHELEDHRMSIHVENVLRNWPGHCSWPGCTCKAVFKIGKRLESHVYNIHVTPLCCAVDGCTYRRPFERQADLNRHVESKHTKKRSYECRYPKCIRSFSRKDKLKLHMRTYHEQYGCKLTHCGRGASSAVGLQYHMRNYPNHGSLECALGSCANTSSSKFFPQFLGKHLVEAHNYPRLDAENLISTTLFKKWYRDENYGGLLTMDDIPDGFPSFKDCEECKKLKETRQD